MAATAGFLLLLVFTASMTVLVPLALVPLAGLALWAARRSRDAGRAAATAEATDATGSAEPAVAGSVRAA